MIVIPQRSTDAANSALASSRKRVGKHLKLCCDSIENNPAQHTIRRLSRPSITAPWANEHGALGVAMGRCEWPTVTARRVGGRGKSWRTILGRGRPGKVGLHLARAVVPPPRLRAKSVLISAPLQPIPDSARWASPGRTGAEKTLQNPAPTPCFMSAQERFLKALFSGDPRETSNLGMEGLGISWSPRAMRFRGLTLH